MRVGSNLSSNPLQETESEHFPKCETSPLNHEQGNILHQRFHLHESSLHEYIKCVISKWNCEFMVSYRCFFKSTMGSLDCADFKLTHPLGNGLGVLNLKFIMQFRKCLVAYLCLYFLTSKLLIAQKYTGVFTLKKWKAIFKKVWKCNMFLKYSSFVSGLQLQTVTVY